VISKGKPVNLGIRPWDPPSLAFAETAAHCLRCGRSEGASLTPTGVPASRVAGLTAAFPALVGSLDRVTGGVSTVLHADPDDCVTGRPAYDAHTRLLLTLGEEPRRPFPNGGPLVARVVCPSPKERHQVGRLYRVPRGSLLLARYWFGSPTVRTGDHMVQTLSDDRVTPVLLAEVLTPPWAGAVEIMCPCRGHFPVDAALVRQLETASASPTPQTFVLA
jgi:hypothetical protein